MTIPNAPAYCRFHPTARQLCPLRGALLGSTLITVPIAQHDSAILRLQHRLVPESFTVSLIDPIKYATTTLRIPIDLSYDPRFPPLGLI